MTMPTQREPARNRAHWLGRSAGLAMFAAAMAVTAPAPAFAQENSEARLRKIEAEIRALQRNVFPGGDGRYFEPQIASEGAAPAQRQGAPSTTAVTDILARLDAIEAQMQQLTARSEESTYALGLLGERVDALEAARTTAAVIPQTTDEEMQEAPEVAEEEDDSSAMESNLAAMTGEGGGDEEPAAATGPTPERIAAVQAITKPQTDDEADDEYSYGFRLWNAGFYPEARQQLTRFVEAYPDHWRATYGRNLLGRAFLDDGNAEDAARWFLRNYQADKTGARAPDSLLFLAESMIALGDTRRACIALAEFGETYPAVATGRLMEDYENNRRRVTCEG